MKDNSPQKQSPLKVSVDEAIKRLEDCENKGLEIRTQIDEAYGSSREKPIRKNLIDRLKSKLGEWIQYSSGMLAEIYSDKSYTKRFGTPGIDDDWFTLDRQKLKANMIEINKDTMKFKYRWEDANRREKELIEKEIVKDIGPIIPHWNYEKKRMISALKSINEARLKFLGDRIAYFEAFGRYPELVALEFPRIDAINEIKRLLDDRPFKEVNMPLDDRFEIAWDEIIHREEGLVSALRKADVKILRTPRRLQFDLEKQAVLGIPMAGKGVLADTFTKGFGWDHQKFTEIWNKSNQIRAEYDEEFECVISRPISDIIKEWKNPLPEYDKDDIRGSFENLGGYLADLDYMIKRIPCIIISKHVIGPAIISRDSRSKREIEVTPRFKIDERLGRIWVNGKPIDVNKKSKYYKAILVLRERAPVEGLAMRPSAILKAVGSRSDRLSSIFRGDKKVLLILFKKNKHGLYYFNNDFSS